LEVGVTVWVSCLPFMPRERVAPGTCVKAVAVPAGTCRT
jgi:hypothetical protein